MNRYRIAVFTAAAVLTTSSVALAAKPKIAILGLEVVANGAMDAKSAKFSTKLTKALRQRASVGAGPYRIAPNSNKDLLEMKLLGGCDSEANDCMSEIGKNLRADFVLYGKIEKRAKGYQVTLKLLDVKGAKLIRNTTEMIAFDDIGKARINEWSRRLYNNLTGTPEQGAVMIAANVKTGTVKVNGEVKGSLVNGSVQISGLPEGKLEVIVESDGYAPFVTEVTVSGGATANIDAKLIDANAIGSTKDGKPGGTSRMLFWATTGVAATGAVVATITGLQVRGSLNDEKNDAIVAYQNSSNGMQLDVNDACKDAKAKGAQAVIDACDKGNSRATLTNVMWGLTAASAAAAGFFFYKGYLQSKGSKSETASKASNRAPVVQITPTVLPSYVGAGVQIEF